MKIIKKITSWIKSKIVTAFDSKNTGFERYQAGLALISIILILIAIFSTMTIWINEKPKFSLGIDGWNGLIEIYSFPLKVGAVVIALITIWITLQRTKLTEVSIKNISDNNKFNNYYKHKDLFKIYMLKTDIYHTIHFYTNVHEDVVISRLYNLFYYKSYENFRPNINEECGKDLEQLVLESKAYEKKDLSSLITEISNGKVNLNVAPFRFSYGDIVGSIYQNLRFELEERNKLIKFPFGFSPHILLDTLHLYVKLELFEDILGFDGDATTLLKLSKSNLKIAVQSYLSHMTLDKKLKLKNIGK